MLILGGALFLLQNLGVLGTGIDILWPILFVLGGLVFLYVFVTNRPQWWAVIPGMALLGLGVMMGLDTMGLQMGGWSGSIFLGATSLAFWLIYLRERQAWWAIIPGGALLTLAAIAGISETPGSSVSGGLFLIGMGLTFLLVWALPTGTTRMRWALIPAGVLLVMGVLLGFGSTTLISYWPIILIAVGAIMIARTWMDRRKER